MEALSELRRIFHPRAVALIGASSGEGKVGRMFMERFLEAGFERLYPVNPREREIFGVETYPSVAEIPEPIDLALVLVPPRAVRKAVEECSACRVKGIAVITGSMGDGGRGVQRRGPGRGSSDQQASGHLAGQARRLRQVSRSESLTDPPPSG